MEVMRIGPGAGTVHDYGDQALLLEFDTTADVLAWADALREANLPGVLDIEHNPYGPTCYGLDPVAMSAWLADFSNTYHARTGRFPVIYTTTSWWNTCTGGNPDFAVNNAMWVARYAPDIGPLPAGWGFHSFWQHSDQGPLPGGQDVFNGGLTQLDQFAG